MAQSKAKKSTNTKSKPKTQTKPKKAPVVDNSPPPAPPAPPVRREVCAFIFLFLALFAAVGVFNTEGAFIAFFTNLIKGLLGWGFWLSVPAFLLSAYIMGFHKGRPVAARVCCALLLPIIFAAMSHLMFGELPDFDDVKVLTNTMFVQGQALCGGGAVGGLLALGLRMLFSIYGAFPLLLALFILCLITALNSSVSDIINKIRERSKLQYEPTEYDYEEAAAAPHPEKNAKRPKSAASQSSPAHTPARGLLMDIPDDSGEEIRPLDISMRENTKKTKGEKPENNNDDDDAAVLPLTYRGKRKPAPTPEKTEEEQNDDFYDFPLTRRAKPQTAPVEKKAEEDVEDGFRDFPLPKREKSEPVEMSTEISDPPKKKKAKRAEVEAEAKAVETAINAAEPIAEGDYVFPPTTLLNSGSGVVADCHDEVMQNRDRLETALYSFGVKSPITNITRGPTVTRYDIELEQGLRVGKVINLAGDLAVALGVMNVRVAPIPNMASTVGIEVPNKIVSTVYLRDIIESQKFVSAKSKLSFALGKDIGGDCIIGNIAKLPHMLIAGTTGSGKSVCMNSLILSLLYKARPDEVRLIMIDPKMVELGVYNGIPHLYVPVVTDPKKAAGALQWSVVEMLKRYRLFSEVGVRDIANYNKHCVENGESAIPQVVIVIDELADLMLVASKEVEESICRIAQMGRAAGMHLVIATQRPSADVITGIMKANIPSRIAFAVSSSLESRIILDVVGAEKLVGMGDMLFSPVGSGKPTRIQGAFVSDEEREEVIQFIKEHAGSAQTNSEIEQFMDKAAESKKSGDSKGEQGEDSAASSFDEMLPQAVEVVLETKQCSVSMLQRRIKLGYSRAARIVDQMEELGIVGPYEGAKPRSVIIDRETWNDLQIQHGFATDLEKMTDCEALEDEEEDE